jgi:hypothetical protein
LTPTLDDLFPKSNVSLAGSKSPTRQVPPPKRYGTQREGGSLRYGDGA